MTLRARIDIEALAAGGRSFRGAKLVLIGKDQDAVPAFTSRAGCSVKCVLAVECALSEILEWHARYSVNNDRKYGFSSPPAVRAVFRSPRMTGSPARLTIYLTRHAAGLALPKSAYDTPSISKAALSPDITEVDCSSITELVKQMIDCWPFPYTCESFDDHIVVLSNAVICDLTATSDSDKL